MAVLAQNMERARLDNDGAELFQLDMPDDCEEASSSVAVVTPSASLDEDHEFDADDGATTVIQKAYMYGESPSRESEVDHGADSWGQFLELDDDDAPRSPALLIVRQLSPSIDVPPARPACF